MTIRDVFASLFEDRQAQERLSELADVVHTNLPTFNLTTTSLRHLNRWIDRLAEIQNHNIPLQPHGNYFSDPGSLGLVNQSTRPPTISDAGEHLLSLSDQLYNNPARGEYELLKTLYSGNFEFPPEVISFLNEKRENMMRTLGQFFPSPSRHLFLEHPSLLVIAELLSSFPGAIPRLLSLNQSDLLDLLELGESGFHQLFDDTPRTRGLFRLCRRIGNDYTRGQERRLHYIVGMTLLSILQNTPEQELSQLQIQQPFSKFLTEVDVYNLHVQYTSELSIWFNGEFFVVGKLVGGIIPENPQFPMPDGVFVHLQPQQHVPSGTSRADPNDDSRHQRRSRRREQTEVIIDSALSERAEDFVEENILLPVHGESLVRVGHRSGETMSLLDNIVPGADFYVIDSNNSPIEFIEVKSINEPPTDITITRAEYLRACRCIDNNLPYRLLLVNVIQGRWWEIENFAREISRLQLSEVTQFTIRVG